MIFLEIIKRELQIAMRKNAEILNQHKSVIYAVSMKRKSWQYYENKKRETKSILNVTS